MVHGPRSVTQRVLILGSAAVGAILRGVAYLPHARWSGVSQLSPIEAWMPLTWWGCVWIATGVVLGLSLAWRRLSLVGMAIFAGLLFSWGASYMYSWIWLDVTRAWVTGALFLMAAVWAGVITSLLERGPRG